MIQWSKCNTWIHALCTDLPGYQYFWFVTTRRQYICTKCTPVSHAISVIFKDKQAGCRPNTCTATEGTQYDNVNDNMVKAGTCNVAMVTVGTQYGNANGKNGNIESSIPASRSVTHVSTSTNTSILPVLRVERDMACQTDPREDINLVKDLLGRFEQSITKTLELSEGRVDTAKLQTLQADLNNIREREAAQKNEMERIKKENNRLQTEVSRLNQHSKKTGSQEITSCNEAIKVQQLESKLLLLSEKYDGIKQHFDTVTQQKDRHIKMLTGEVDREHNISCRKDEQIERLQGQLQVMYDKLAVQIDRNIAVHLEMEDRIGTNVHSLIKTVTDSCHDLKSISQDSFQLAKNTCKPTNSQKKDLTTTNRYDVQSLSLVRPIKHRPTMLKKEMRKKICTQMPRQHTVRTGREKNHKIRGTFLSEIINCGIINTMEVVNTKRR